MSRNVTFALVTAFVLAGCSSATEIAEEVGPDETVARPTDTPPTWNRNDWWSYQFADGTLATWVVTQDGGSAYTVETTEPEWAFADEYAKFDPMFDTSTIGPIRKSDLAGSQGGQPVEYFQWPLQDEAVWSTKWDGHSREITATMVDEDTFTFEATAAGMTEVKYTYRASDKWFTGLEFFQDGVPTISAFLVTRGENYTGEIPRWSYDEAAEATVTGSGSQSGSYQVPDDVTDVWAFLRVTCEAAGDVQVSTGPVQNAALGGEAGYSIEGPCPLDDGFAGSIGSEPRQGWGYIISSSSADAEIYLHALTRTYEPITIP